MLSQQRIQQIQSLLKQRFTTPNLVSLPELQGYLYAFALSPSSIAANEWMPWIFGGRLPSFEEQRLGVELLEVLAGASQELREQYASHSLQFPFDLEQQQASRMEEVFDWTRGFHDGLQLRPDLWFPKNAPEGVEKLPIEEALAVLYMLAYPEETDHYFEKGDQRPRWDSLELDEQEHYLQQIIPLLPAAFSTLQDYSRHLPH